MNPYYQPTYGNSSAPPVVVVAEPIIPGGKLGNYSSTPSTNFAAPYPTTVVQFCSEGESFLSSQSWPKALQAAFFNNLPKIAIRFFICDDSGSMGTEDGKTIYSYKEKVSAVKCSRWKELTNSLKFHLELAKIGGIPTEFRFLNSSGPLRVGFPDFHESEQSYERMKGILNDGSPGGGTPLCRHIYEVTQIVRFYEAQLRAAGQVVCLVIATDGEASDGNIADVLRPLKSLPVWIVLRFCTDDEKVIDYWNKVENDLELNMDVLDDYFGEAEEIHKANPWLTYGEPVHRMREFGVTIKEMDKIDESLLSADEMIKVCRMCVGSIVDTFPHPQVDMKAFSRELTSALSLEPKIWDPITQKSHPWIKIAELKKHYHSASRGCVII